jgi:hypothetical protein
MSVLQHVPRHGACDRAPNRAEHAAAQLVAQEASARQAHARSENAPLAFCARPARPGRAAGAWVVVPVGVGAGAGERGLGGGSVRCALRGVVSGLVVVVLVGGGVVWGGGVLLGGGSAVSEL